MARPLSIFFLFAMMCGCWCLPRPLSPVTRAQVGLTMRFIQKQMVRREEPQRTRPLLSSPWSNESPQISGIKGNKNNVMSLNFTDVVVFPDNIPIRVNRTKKKEECTKYYCLEANDYPSDLVNALLTNTRSEYRSLFEKEDFDPLTNRLDPSEGEPMCQSKEEVITPQKAMNKNQKWMFVLQDTKSGELVQSVRIETCLRGGANENEEPSCQYTHSLLPLGYKTSCKQKYIYKKLLAIPADGKPQRPSLEHFQIPSCCSCTVTVSPGVLSRTDVDGPTSKPSQAPKPTPKP